MSENGISMLLFNLILYAPVNIFFSYVGTGLPELYQYHARINVFAQGHNVVTPVRLEPATPRFRLKRTTTEPLRSLYQRPLYQNNTSCLVHILSFNVLYEVCRIHMKNRLFAFVTIREKQFTNSNVGPDLGPNCLTPRWYWWKNFNKWFWKIKISRRHTNHEKILSMQNVNSVTLKAPITTAADDKFCDIFPNFRKKIRYDIVWESSASSRFSWNIMPYLLFLKKWQNLILSSAANSW